MTGLQLLGFGIIMVVGAVSFLRGGDTGKVLTFVLLMAVVVTVVVKLARSM